MSKNMVAILSALALIAFATIMTGFHWLMTGINEDFGTGLVVGLMLGMGIIFLLSREARELP